MWKPPEYPGACFDLHFDRFDGLIFEAEKPVVTSRYMPVVPPRVVRKVSEGLARIVGARSSFNASCGHGSTHRIGESEGTH